MAGKRREYCMQIRVSCVKDRRILYEDKDVLCRVCQIREYCLQIKVYCV